jgi:hypothetical protein
MREFQLRIDRNDLAPVCLQPRHIGLQAQYEFRMKQFWHLKVHFGVVLILWITFIVIRTDAGAFTRDHLVAFPGHFLIPEVYDSSGEETFLIYPGAGEEWEVRAAGFDVVTVFRAVGVVDAAATGVDGKWLATRADAGDFLVWYAELREESVVGGGGFAGGEGQVGVAVGVAHVAGFDLPVEGRVLDDTKAIEPEEPDAKLAGDDDGILKSFGQPAPWDALLMGFQGFGCGFQRLAVAPAVT